jgi:hypothetical protein
MFFSLKGPNFYIIKEKIVYFSGQRSFNNNGISFLQHAIIRKAAVIWFTVNVGDRLDEGTKRILVSTKILFRTRILADEGTRPQHVQADYLRKSVPLNLFASKAESWATLLIFMNIFAAST